MTLQTLDRFLFWWLPRNEEGPPEEEEGAGGTEHSAGRGPEQGVEQQVEAVKEVIPDDLTVIEDRAKRPEELRSLGIMTFEDLARADPDRLVDQLKTSLPVSKARVRGWTEVARERTEASGLKEGLHRRRLGPPSTSRQRHWYHTAVPVRLFPGSGVAAFQDDWRPLISGSSCSSSRDPSISGASGGRNGF